MIKIQNTGGTVRLVDNRTYTQIILTKDVKITPRKMFNIKTGLTITCSEDIEECWIYTDLILDTTNKSKINFDATCLGILTQRITKADGNVKVNLVGGLMQDEPIVLTAGMEIARIYKSVMNIEGVDVKEITYAPIFNDNGVIIKTSPAYTGNYEMILDPSGETYIKMKLPN